MALVRQDSFASGELSPTLYARTRLAQYGAGVRSLRNFFVTPFGAAQNRPGTAYVGLPKYNMNPAQQWQLVPFVFSDDQVLVLEFGDQYVRFWDAATRSQVMSGGVPYELATPYNDADIRKLRWAQKGNVVTLTCKGYDSYTLERTSISPLTVVLTVDSFDAPVGPSMSVSGGANVAFDPGWPTVVPQDDARPWLWIITALCQSLDGQRNWEAPLASTAETWGAAYAMRRPTAGAWNSGTTYAANDCATYLGVTWRSLSAGNLNHAPGWSIFTYWAPFMYQPMPGTGAWAYGGDWLYYQGPVSLPVHKPTVDWHPVTPSGYRVVKYCVYRGQSPDFVGLVAIVPPTTTTFADCGDMSPDYNTRPPKGENPFKVYDANGALVRTEKPVAVAFHDERRVYGGTDYRSNYLFLSRLGDWSNFDQYALVKADDAIVAGLAFKKYEEIRDLVSGRALLIFTSSSEWQADGGGADGGGAITPTTLVARPRTERGSGWLHALRLGDDRVLFVQRRGGVPREFVYDGVTSTYQARDAALLARHLFEGHEIIDWAFQDNPWPVVWAVRDDGVLLSYTVLPEQHVAAWARHDTGGGDTFESVCVVPGPEEDEVWVVVRRQIGGDVAAYIECLTTRQIEEDDGRDGCFLDSSVTYDGRGS